MEQDYQKQRIEKNQKYCLGKEFFEKYQKILLWLLNTPIVKYWFRYVMRIHSFDCAFNKKIDEIFPNYFTFDKKIVLADYLIFKDGHRELFDKDSGKHRKIYRKLKIEKGFALQRTVDCRTHNKYTKRLYYAFYPLWVLCHAWDTLIANKYEPAWNLGFDTLTVYPDAGTGATTVDGSVGDFSNGNITWASLIAEPGSAAYPTTDDISIINYQYNQSGWQTIQRAIFLFDTSSLPDDSVISAAILSLYGTSKGVENTGNIPNVNIYSSNPASNNNLVAGDFDSLGSTAFATAIAYTDYNTAGYNDFTFNSTGRDAISKIGISKFGTRNANYDVAGSEPPNKVAQGNDWINAYTADQTGTTQDPKLTVTYTVPVKDNSIFFSCNF